jgi:hypothetical protein
MGRPVVSVQEADLSESDRLTVLIHKMDSAAIGTLLSNAALEERHVQLLLRRRDLAGEVLEQIGANRKWLANETIRFGLAVHALTPRRLAMTLLRQLFAVNLVRVALHPSAPAEVRCIAEELVIERIRQLPLAEKLVLARCGPARVAGALLAEGHSDVLRAVLQSPFLTEAQVVRVLWRASVPPHVVVTIAEDVKWSSRYLVRLALVRNAHTPVAAAVRFLPNLLLSDLRELVRSGSLPGHLREHVKREVTRRGGLPRK